VNRVSTLALLLLALMFVWAGGAALRESVTIDEVAHIGSASAICTSSTCASRDIRRSPKYWLPLPLVARGTRADYSGTIWT